MRTLARIISVPATLVSLFLLFAVIHAFTVHYSFGGHPRYVVCVLFVLGAVCMLLGTVKAWRRDPFSVEPAPYYREATTSPR